MKLLNVDTSDKVRKKIDESFTDSYDRWEQIPIGQSLGRIAFEDVLSPIELPQFSRSVVDGYAVLSRDTYGAGESMPVFLDVSGHVEMGKAAEGKVSAGEAIYVPTGAMIPEGADAVVMIEYVENLDESTVAVYTPVAPGQGIIQKGDDVELDSKVLSKGEKIKSRDIGVLSALGIEYIKVFKKLRLSVISTGDEIVDSFGEVQYGQIRDINTHLISAMAEESGAEISLKLLVPDDFSKLREAIGQALKMSDIVVLSGGSSVGAKDMTAKAIESIEGGQVFVHGVAVKPGKPTIIGRAGGKALFGLPGHPSSAMVIYKVFVDHLIRKYYYMSEDTVYIQASCGENIHSAPGKETYQPVELIERDGEYEAAPIYGKSAAITTVARSMGYIRISENKEGVKKGEKVRVALF
ncbi:molybdopterin molybdotransferase MoeA [Lutispora saccharofermentans]|uniref:Molybdopterin molybdenumtransferase n=1 Tax=Lutispora saccharofermentans TaxID=3024236 RepID=A0ABT1NCD9_9FIRM|nr:gephyrin-like molybdotransferase Glp [Lutispora saccharofermentans]MCQ1528699.1 molybdopterin molybdotransferase MoeA [Lutispora saccharofermentans]